MKKLICCGILFISVFIVAISALAWSADGIISGTDLSYSGMTIAKNGVSLKMTNNSDSDVRVSLKLSFWDKDGNESGYSLFGVRVIPARSDVDIAGNHLTGKWKLCKNAPKMIFEKMTYEPIYY